MRLKRNHSGALIGGFDPDQLREDDIGLYGVAEINLAVREGGEAYALAKQGVLSDFSVGFSASPEDVEIIDGLRKFKRARVWETSLVDEPMNARAVVTMVRGVIDTAELPTTVASKELDYDGEGALDRIRKMTGSDEAPSETYRNAFLWYDESAPDEYGSYKLPVADVVDGELAIVPRAVFAAAAALQGARGGVDIPDEDRPGVERAINELYERMEMESPFERGQWSMEEVRGLAKGDRRHILKTQRLSRNVIDYLVDAFQPGSTQGATEAADIVGDIRSINEAEDAKAIREIADLLKGVTRE
jgi:hypothetical protein